MQHNGEMKENVQSFICIMNDATYKKFQQCCGLNFEKETRRQQRLLTKKKRIALRKQLGYIP